MKEIISGLKEKLAGSVERNNASCMLFSGGLDTSILSCLNRSSLAINVSLESFGEDYKYAKFMEEHLGLELINIKVAVDEAVESIPHVIKILKSFDPAIPNDLVVYFGLKAVKDKGFKKVMTGDGADELFGGYSYMQGMKDLEGYIRRLSENMYYNSNRLGKDFNIRIRQPFIDKEVKDFSFLIPVDFKIRKDKGETWGKWALRKAFENDLPEKVIWQSKRPLEYGSGMTELREIISSKVSDEEFKEAEKSSGIKFLSKEHYYYYNIYRKEVGEIPEPESTEKDCPGCGAGMNKVMHHCRICGYVGT
ncbi:asparagine synthase-related protein [Elusimicrobiota bacterium]